MRALLIIASLPLVLLGCTQNISQKSYPIGSVGQLNRSIAAKVISVREVDIAGSSEAGAIVGGASGAASGSSAGGHDAKSNIAGAVAGAVIGATIGGSIERGITSQKGIEYVLETENGNLITIVQGTDITFKINDKVLVLYGSPSRIITDPR